MRCCCCSRCCCFTHSAYYVHATKETYTVTQLFSQTNQITISYVPDPLVVIKRRKGQQATSCCVHHYGSKLRQQKISLSAVLTQLQVDSYACKKSFEDET